MTLRSFFLKLILLTVLTAGALAAIHSFVPLLREHQLLSWLSMGFFFLLSLLMFLTGNATARSENKNMFTSAVLGFVFGKMALALLIVIIYTKEVEPDSKYFILPFFLVYLVYTVFETWFLIRLGRQNSTEAHVK
jgi:MFS family permease